MTCHRISDLASDVLAIIALHLHVSDMLHLYLCGDGPLNRRLTLGGGLRHAKVLFSPPTPYVVPHFLSRLQGLESCEILSDTCNYIRDVDLSILPRGLRKLIVRVAVESER